MKRPNLSAEKERMRRIATARYLRGQSQHEIAAAMEIHQSTVSRYLEISRQRWRELAVRDFDEARGKELDRIDHLERTYWEAWERSRKPQEVRQYESTPGGRSRKRRIVGQVGGACYLVGVQWCIDKRCRLLGLDRELPAPEHRERLSADVAAMVATVVPPGLLLPPTSPGTVTT